MSRIVHSRFVVVIDMARRLFALFSFEFIVLMWLLNVRYSSKIIPTYLTSLDSTSFTPFILIFTSGSGVGYIQLFE